MAPIKEKDIDVQSSKSSLRGHYQVSNSKYDKEEASEQPQITRPRKENKAQESGLKFHSTDYCVQGGKYATGYEGFVQKLFAPGDERHQTDPSFILNYSFPSTALPNTMTLPASMQLKLEGYGSDAIADHMLLSTLLGGGSPGAAAASAAKRLGRSSSPSGGSHTSGIRSQDYQTTVRYGNVGQKSGFGSFDKNSYTSPDYNYGSDLKKINSLKLYEPKSIWTAADGTKNSYHKRGKILTKIGKNPSTGETAYYSEFTSVPASQYIYHVDRDAKYYDSGFRGSASLSDNIGSRNKSSSAIKTNRSSCNRVSDIGTSNFDGHRRIGDTRIVGSNFVMAANRPDDLFFSKIDKTLDQAKKVNSWDV